jgi:exosome complex RNA-binding protein Rrp4
MTTLLRCNEQTGEILDASGKVIGKVVPVEPSRTLVDTGAQALAMFENYSVWPDSWDPVQVRQMRSDAKKAYRAMNDAYNVLVTCIEDADTSDETKQLEALTERLCDLCFQAFTLNGVNSKAQLDAAKEAK